MGFDNINVNISGPVQPASTYKTKVLKGNHSFASQVTEPNMKYVIKHNFDLGGSEITIPDNCILEFDGGSLSNGSLVLQNTLFDGVVNLGSDLEISGTCDNEEIKQYWFVNGDVDAFFSFINNVTTNRDTLIYLFKAGTYYPTIRVNKTSDKNIVLRGNGATLIYNRNIIVEGSYMIHFEVAQTDNRQYFLREAVDKSSGNIPLDSIEGINIGDTITIRDSANSSFSHYRNYQQGEVFKVRGFSVNAQNAIVPDNYLFGNYAHISNGESYVIKTDFRNLSVEGLTLKMSEKEEATFDSRGICFTHYRTNIQNIEIQDFRYCMDLEYCIDGKVSNCVIIANSITASNVDCYGLLIENCQNIVVNGGKYYGGNHGIAVGGHYNTFYSIVNRLITICNTECLSYKFRIGIDAHGNTEYCNYVNNYTDGIKYGANHSIVSGNIVTRYIEQNEPCGLDIQIKNNICTSFYYTYSDSTTYSGATLDNEPKHEGESLIISGNTINDDLIVSLSTKVRDNGTHIDKAQVLVSDNKIKNVCKSTMFLYDTDDELKQDSEYSVVYRNNELADADGARTEATNVSLVGNRSGKNLQASCKSLELFDNVSKISDPNIGSFIKVINTSYTFERGFVYNNKAYCSFINLTDIQDTQFNLYCKNNTAYNDARFINLDPVTEDDAQFNIYFDDNDIVTGRFCNNHSVPIKSIITRKYEGIADIHSYPSIPNELGIILYKNRRINNTNAYKNSIGNKMPLANIEGTKLADNNDTFKIPYRVINGNYLCGLLAVKYNDSNVLLFVYSTGSDAIATHFAGSLFDFGGISFARDTANGYFYIKFNDTTKITGANYISINTTIKDDEFCTSCVSSDLSDITFRNVIIKDTDGTTAGVARSGETTGRPGGRDIYVGFMYFDTSLGKPIYASAISGNTVTWVDATGATV